MKNIITKDFPAKIIKDSGIWYISSKRQKTPIDLDAGNWFISIADAYNETISVYVFEDIKDLLLNWAQVRLNYNGECMVCDGEHVWTFHDIYEKPIQSVIGVERIFDEEEFFDWLFTEYSFADQRIVRLFVENAISYAEKFLDSDSTYPFLASMLGGILDHPLEEVKLLII